MKETNKLNELEKEMDTVREKIIKAASVNNMSSNGVIALAQQYSRLQVKRFILEQESEIA